MLPIKFRFKAVDEGIVYTAEKVLNNTYRVSWNEKDFVNSQHYNQISVEEHVIRGNWVILEEDTHYGALDTLLEFTSLGGTVDIRGGKISLFYGQIPGVAISRSFTPDQLKLGIKAILDLDAAFKEIENQKKSEGTS